MAYCAASDVKTYAGIGGGGDDSLIAQLVAAAQAAIDSYCHRTFEAASDSTRYYTVGRDTWGRELWLDEDLASITTVKTNADAGTATTLASTEYVTMPRNRTPYHAIILKRSAQKYWEWTDDPEAGIEITGKWAYSTAAPADVKQACIRLATYYYRQKDAGVFDVTAMPEAGVIMVPQGMPRDVQVILNPYRKL